MIRALLVFLSLTAASHLAAAQAPSRPILRTKLETKSAIPGQPIVLRINLLAPTWFPKPPVFPSFEIANVMVRLPPRASSPISERIGDETWSGVTRAYRLYPLTVGRFRIPPQPVTVIFAHPRTRKPVTVELFTDEIEFEGTAPAGAADLDPFIAAEALTLEQTIEGKPGDLAPGGAFTRTVTARIKGTSPIFVPPLIPPFAAEGISAYPKEPVVTEAEKQGLMSGERVESITYVAETGGRHTVPPISLRWYNLGTKQIETAGTDGIDIVARGPPVESPPTFDWRAASPWIILCGLFIVLTGVAAFQLWPRFARWLQRRREAHLASESFAFDQAVKAVRARDFAAAVRAIELWSSRHTPSPGSSDIRLSDALANLGAAIYGRDQQWPSSTQWSEALAALRSARRERLGPSVGAHTSRLLGPLNPRQVQQ